jgi:hypothetical protein
MQHTIDDTEKLEDTRKIVAVNRSTDTVPYMVCICKDFHITDDETLMIHLDNAPYRTDGTSKDDTIVIASDNWDWVDDWDVHEETLVPFKLFRNYNNE